MSPASSTITAVLPCVRGDAPRARLLLQSLIKYQSPFRTVLLMCPSRHVEWFQEEFSDLRAKLSIEIIDEKTIVPELNECWWLRGWMKQQLLKLAVAHHVKTDYFLTLDADVVLTRDTEIAEFLPDGKAAYAYLHPTPHMSWYRASWRVLDMPARSKQLEHNVTPTILSRKATLKLAHFLEKRADDIVRSPELKTLIQRRRLKRRESHFPAGTRKWTLLLAAFAMWPILEWTEYSLYYCFLEENGLIEQFHTLVEKPLYDTKISVHKKHTHKFAKINWNQVFQQGSMSEEQRSQRPFVIIQSVSKVPLETIVDTFTPLLQQPEKA